MPVPNRFNRFAMTILAVAILAAGCWDRREIEETTFVMQFGLDRHPEGGVIMSAQVAIPQLLGGGGGGGAGQVSDQPPFYVTTARGNTVDEAFAAAASIHGRRGIRSHAAALVIGEDLARAGIRGIADFILRDRELRYFTPVFIADDEARSLLSVVPTQEREAWQFVRSLSVNTARRGNAPNVRIHEMLLALSQPGEDLLLPRLRRESTALEPISPPGTGTEQAGAGNQSQGFLPPGDTLQAYGAAVFRGERMVGWMTEREVRGVMWVRGLGLRDPVIPVEVDGERPQVSLQVIRRSFAVKPQIVGGQVERIALTLSVEANVSEVSGKDHFYTRAGLKDLAQRLHVEIQREIEDAIQAAQQFEADVFGFGEEVRARMPHRLWRQLDWRREFARVPIDVQVETELRRTGAITDPLPRR